MGLTPKLLDVTEMYENISHLKKKNKFGKTTSQMELSTFNQMETEKIRKLLNIHAEDLCSLYKELKRIF